MSKTDQAEASKDAGETTRPSTGAQSFNLPEVAWELLVNNTLYNFRYD